MTQVTPQVETDIDDAGLGRVIVVGSAIGIPLIFLISLLLSLPGAGWPLAPAIAVWPALVGGPFVGGFLALMKTMAAQNPTASVVSLPVAERSPVPETAAA